MDNVQAELLNGRCAELNGLLKGAVVDRVELTERGWDWDFVAWLKLPNGRWHTLVLDLEATVPPEWRKAPRGPLRP